MQSLWNDADAAQFGGDLELRVYTSRLLGRDPSLVLHGGGNTSVKILETNIFGEEEEILYVKGSGSDLDTIDKNGFTPVRLAHIRRMATLDSLSDVEMVNQLKCNQTIATAPTPSVETVLHAIIPFRYVDHTHADAVLAITNSVDGPAHIRDIYGKDTIILPYVKPGFDLARSVARQLFQQQRTPVTGIVLMNHGIFSFGDTAQESYERMIELVNRAEDYIKDIGAWDIPEKDYGDELGEERLELSKLRREASDLAGFPMILTCPLDSSSIMFARRADIKDISQRGPATPDHAIRTKPLPLYGRSFNAYARQYKEYFDENVRRSQDGAMMLDPAPRIILDPEFGLIALGRNAKEASIASDIYRHTMTIISRAEQLGGWRALPAQDIFDVEYWSLEQAKLRLKTRPPVFQGEIALVTGAASGIGKACAESLLQRGAAVIGLDVNPRILELYKDQESFLGLVCDVTDLSALRTALEQGVRRFGGLDMLILNAGIFPDSRNISDLADEEWRTVMSVNLDANMRLMRECYPLLQQAPRAGRIVVIGSRNVTAPGPGAAAYSASKAALNQLARVAALEWGKDGIRINILHPDAVFDTGIWTDEILRSRAERYSMTIEEYKNRNVLSTEVCSKDVADLAAEMCGPLFSKTTAAQISIDGGNDRVI